MARQYSAGTDLINLGSSSSLDPASKTISIWFISANVSSGSVYSAICSRNNAGTHGYDIYIDGLAANKIFWGWVNGTNGGSITVSNNTWTHIALVLDSAAGTAKGYINGVQDFSGSYTYTLVSATSYIGADPNNQNFGGFAVGSLADFALWSAALTVPEITALSKGARPFAIRPQSIRCWHELNDNGHPALDRSIYNFNGTVTGTTLVPGPPLINAAPIMLTTVNSGEAFLKRSPLMVAAALPKIKASAASPIVFRKTLSQIGGRVGSRQIQGWAN